jgi:RNA polymerase sigma-70 factor (ECF subfamily)
MALLNDTVPFRRAVRLVARCGPQAEAAFSGLFRSYAGRLRAYVVTRVRDEGETDDVVQETFIRFLRAIRDGRPIRHASYLWAIADAVITDRHRMRTAAARDVERTDEYRDDLLLDHSDRTESPERQELLDCIHDSLNAYSKKFPKHSRVIELAVLEQWTVAEIASYLERTRGATRQYLYECRKKLRAIVTERCGEML